jgi:hypothetical protein
MLYDPDTVWGRTEAGDREIKVPRSGLSVTQRRLLQELMPPRSFMKLAARHRIEPPKLENELVRLAELELVAFQRPGVARPRTAPRIHLALPPVTQREISSPGMRYLAMLAFVVGFAAVLLLAV